MTEFIKKVRNGLIPQPTQKSYDLTIWDDAFLRINEPATEDIRLHETGKWIFQKLELIRRKLTPTWVKGLSKRDQLLLFVGGANRDCHLLANMTVPVDSKEIFVMEQIIQAKVEQPYGLGPANPEAMLLSSIDSLRFPIRMVHVLKECQENESIAADLEILNRVRISAYLAQIYSIIEGYWMEALWNGWYIDSKARDDSDLVAPPNNVIPLVTAISDYRRQALVSELVLHFSHEWKYDLTETQKRLLTHRLPKISVLTEGSDRRFGVSNRTEANEEVMINLIKAFQAERGYYSPLVDEPLEKLGSITLRMLLQAWQVIYALAEVLMSTFPSVEDSGVYSIDKLLRYAPTIHKEELVALLMQWCKFDKDVAHGVVEFFSYGPQQTGELWGHPLVEVSDTEVTPVLAPIRYSNIERTFELWMKGSGFKLTDKGPLFEHYARIELTQSLNRSEILNNAAVHPTNVVFNHDEVEEEIDIVVRVGNKILIGEAKCFLFPAEPIEIANYFEALEKAAIQVQRKADFVRSNLPKFVDQLGIVTSRPADLSIEPFVMVNQPFGAGFTHRDVPIVDELILKRFFEGKWYGLGIYSEEGLEAQSTFRLYKDEEEAASTISAYLRNPPQLRHYRQNVKPNIQWYPALDETDRPFATVYFEVVLPLPSLDLHFDKK